MFKKMSFSIITFILTFSLFISFTANAEEDNKKQGNLGKYVDEITNIHEYTSKLGFKLSDDNIKYDISEALIDRDFYTVTIVDFKNKKYYKLYVKFNQIIAHKEIVNPGEGTRYNEKYKNMDKILNQLELPNYNVNNFIKLEPYGQSGYFDVIDFDKKKYYKVYIRNGGGYANEVEFYGIIPLQSY